MKAKYYALSRPFTPGSPIQIPPFADTTGKTGGRNIIEKYVLEIAYNVTVANAAFNGENWPNLFTNILVQKASGTRRKVSGPGHRVAVQEMMGLKNFQEGPDLAVGAQSGTFYMEIPFCPKRAKDPKEWAIEADLMRNLELHCGPATCLNFGTSVVTINDIDIVVWAHTFEEPHLGQKGSRVKLDDYIFEEQMVALARHNQKLDDEGAYLDFQLAYKNGDQLTDMSSWTAHSLQPIHEVSESQAAKVYDHVANTDSADYPDLISGATQKVIVIHETPGATPKLKDMPRVRETTIRNTGNTVADAMILQRIIPPQNRLVRDKLVARGGRMAPVAPGASEFRELKTV